MRSLFHRIALPLGAICLSSASFASSVPVTYRTMSASKAGYFSGNVHIPNFGYGSSVASLASRSVGTAMRTGFNEFVRESREMSVDQDLKKMWKANGGKPTEPYSYDSNCTASLADSSLISVLRETVAYTGGAHPNTFLRPSNFGLVDGKAKQLTLKDILRPGQTQALVDALIIPKLVEIKKARFGADVQTPTVDAELAERWLATASGISWVFENYAVGAYAEGRYVVKFTWAELAPYLRTSSPLAPAMKSVVGGVRDSRITGVVWQLTGFEYSDDTKVAVEDPSKYTLQIMADGKTAIRADVNRGTAVATGGSGQLSFKMGGLTRAMPGPGSHHDRFLKDLPYVGSYVVQGGKLYLNLKMDGGNLIFRKAP